MGIRLTNTQTEVTDTTDHSTHALATTGARVGAKQMLMAEVTDRLCRYCRQTDCSVNRQT